MILAIDTSTRLAGVAIYDGTQVLAETIWHSQNYHTVELTPTIQGMLRQAGISISSLKGVAVAVGPGSFTGLRIGLAVAKGICLGGNIPIIGIPTLDFLAAAQPLLDMALLAVLRAGRGRLSVDSYQVVDGNWRSENQLKIVDIHTLSQSINKQTFICGELTGEERRFLGRKWKNVILASPAQSIRRPAFLAEMAWQRFLDNQVDDPVTLAPIYLHIGDPIPE